MKVRVFFSLTVLLDEFSVKAFKDIHHLFKLVVLRENRCAEVIRSWKLT